MLKLSFSICHNSVLFLDLELYIYTDMIDRAIYRAIAPELRTCTLECDVWQDVLEAKIDRSKVALDEMSALGSLQKFQKIGESRAGIAAAYRRISEIQTIHNDVHQLLKTDFFGSLTWARCRAITITY